MKLSQTLFVFAFLFSPLTSTALSDYGAACGDVKRLRVWANGSDKYGIWLEFENNPSACPGGFYIPHSGDNKQYVFSLALAAKAAGDKVCVQIRGLDDNIQNRCVLNYIRHP